MAMSVVYTNFGGMLVHEDRGGTERQYVSDTLGSLIGELDSTQATTYTAEYWPYGEVQTETGTNTSPWNFVGLLGYLRDLASLLYVRARHYLNSKGRWLTVDKLWPREMAYGYATLLPSLLIDPSGLQRKGRPIRRAPGLPIEDALELAQELCGNGDPIGCKGVNDQLPICIKGSPNWDACGRAIFGDNPNAGNRGSGNDANFSNWPRQCPQVSWLPEPLCWLGSEYCCMECMMRVCCHFGPGHPPFQGPPAPIRPGPPPSSWPGGYPGQNVSPKGLPSRIM